MMLTTAKKSAERSSMCPVMQQNVITKDNTLYTGFLERITNNALQSVIPDKM